MEHLYQVLSLLTTRGVLFPPWPKVDLLKEKEIIQFVCVVCLTRIEPVLSHGMQGHLYTLSILKALFSAN